MDYEFLTTCAKCGKEVAVFWVMDPMRVGPESVARITCPVCGESFYRTVSDLRPFKARGPYLLTGHPVRTVELVYDCPCCGMLGISVSLVHTDLPWEELSGEAIKIIVCNNAICPKRGLQQQLEPTHTRLGTLNPSWG